MRAHEFITEKKSSKKPHPEHEAVMPSAYKVAGTKDKLIDLNRVMRAAAATDGKSVPKLEDNWFGLSDTAHPYTKEEAEMMKKAFKAANVEWSDALYPNPSNKSKEPNGTNTSSPMKGFEGYGIKSKK